MNRLKQLPMRNLWRMLAFDILAPLAAIAGLLMIGWVLDWPWWWISACSVLVLLVVEAVVLNFVLLRRDSVTVGTDDERPAFRTVAVALCTAALVAAAVLEYLHWTRPDQDLERDSAQVVQVATEMSETAATVAPADPNSSIERAAEFMVPDRVDAFKSSIGRSATEMANRNITVQAQTLAAGVEAIGPSAARVAVILRSTQTAANEEVRQMVVPVRITLSKRDGRWLVLEMSPIHIR